MKILKTPIKDLIIIKTEVFKDNRGFFKEVVKKNLLNKKFIFDCLSHSKKNTLRGLHFQKKISSRKTNNSG
jgi:dTDP-4-dehydrorhamnose 3,5-epimerase